MTAVNTCVADDEVVRGHYSDENAVIVEGAMPEKQSVDHAFERGRVIFVSRDEAFEIFKNCMQQIRATSSKPDKLIIPICINLARIRL